MLIDRFVSASALIKFEEHERELAAHKAQEVCCGGVFVCVRACVRACVLIYARLAYVHVRAPDSATGDGNNERSNY